MVERGENEPLGSERLEQVIYFVLHVAGEYETLITLLWSRGTRRGWE
jgi:hypothetical protein